MIFLRKLNHDCNLNQMDFFKKALIFFHPGSKIPGSVVFSERLKNTVMPIDPCLFQSKLYVVNISMWNFNAKWYRRKKYHNVSNVHMMEQYNMRYQGG